MTDSLVSTCTMELKDERGTNRFGIAMTPADVWRYLNGDAPTKGSVFPRETVRDLMRRDKIKSYYKSGRLFTFRSNVDAYIEEVKRMGDADLDIVPINMEEWIRSVRQRSRRRRLT